MPTKTKIQWTESTWNPITGCTKVSPGCAHCYAEVMAKRLKAMGRPEYANVTSYIGLWNGYIDFAGPERLEAPLRRRKPQMIFVNSMSDLFHPDVPTAWIDAVISVIAASPWHTYQVLTKRAARMKEYFSDYGLTHRIFDMVKEHRNKFKRLQPFGIELPLPNLWLGVSVENQKCADERIPLLLETPARIKILSCEPLLEKVDLRLYQWEASYGERDFEQIYRSDMIQWVICGGESGTDARPMHPDWARSIRDQCQYENVPFFFKQWGEWGQRVDGDNFVRLGKKKLGRLLDGQEYNEFPKVDGDK